MFIVFARIEDDKNITGFIVENDPENGISLGDEEKKLGIHSSSTRQVFFNETKVPVENMLSERGNGFKIAMNARYLGVVHGPEGWKLSWEGPLKKLIQRCADLKSL